MAFSQSQSSSIRKLALVQSRLARKVAIGLCIVAVLASQLAPIAQAATYYWDTNGATAGFGTASGTWGTSTFWSTNAAGTAATANSAVTTADTVNFGTTLGLGAGTISVGTVNSGAIMFGPASGAIVLSGGTITLAAAEVITVSNSSDTIGSVLSGATTSLTVNGPGTLTLSADNTYSGATIVNGAGLIVGSGGAGSISSGALQLTNSTLTYGNTAADQTVGNLTFNAGLSTINNTSSGHSFSFGGITRAANQFGVLNFGITTGTISTSFTNVNGIIGAWASFGSGTALRYAVSNGIGSAITGLTGTAATPSDLSNVTDATSNYEFAAAATTTTDLTANTLRYSGNASTTTIGSGSTLKLNGLMNAGTGALTISGGPSTGGIVIGSNNELVIAANTQDTNIAAVISNGSSAGSVTYNGAGGTLTLSGANLFTGSVNVNAGTLTLAGANAFTGGVNINGGTLKLASAGAINATAPNVVTYGSASTGKLTLNGNSVTIKTLSSSAVVGSPIIENASATPVTLTLGNAANTASTFAGSIQDGAGGALTLVKNGTGILTLSGTNTYSGGTVINGGKLVLSTSDANLGAASGPITFNASVQFQPPGNWVSSRNIVLNNGVTLSIGGNSIYTTSGNVTGNGGVTASSFSFGSSVVLNGTNNTFTGPIIIGQGGTGGTWWNVSVASLADSATANGLIQLNNGSTYASSGRSDGFIYTGTRSLILNNRQLVVASSTTQAGSFFNNSSNNSSIVINTPVTGAVGSTAGTARILNLGGTSTGVNTISGAITDGSGTTVSVNIAAGTWIFSGSNSYTGATTINGGALIAHNAVALSGTASVTAATNTRFIYNAATDTPLSISGTLAITGGANTVIGASIGSTATSAEIGVAGTATISNAAHKINIYAVNGVTHFNGGFVTLIHAADGSSIAPTAVPTLGTVYNNTDFTINLTAGDGGTQPFTRTATDIQVTTVAATALTTAYWNGGLSGNANVWSASDGSATSNWVASMGGSAQALAPGAGADVTFSNSTVTTAPTATVLGSDMSIKGLTISDNANNFALNADGYALTIGAGGITKSNTTPETATIAANVVLGANQTWNNSDTTNALVVSGVISGTGNLIKGGPGMVTLTGISTYTGSTTIAAGTLQLGNGNLGGDGTIGGSSGIVNNGTLIYNRFDSVSSSVPISGSGTVVKQGAGIQTLNAVNTYTGVTNIQAGTLALGATGSINNSSLISLSPGATFDVSAVSGYTLAQTLAAKGAGTASIVGAINVSSKTLDIKDGVNIGTLALSSDLSLNGATLTFDLSATTSDQIAVTGAATLAGTNTISVGALTTASSLAVGSHAYTLLTAGSGLVSSNFTLSSTTATVNSTTYNFSLSGDATHEYLDVSSGAAAVAGTWAVNASGSWNTAGNWSGGVPGLSGTSAGNDTATFAAAATSVNPIVTLDGVSPVLKGITFNNAAHGYTIAQGTGGTLTLNGGASPSTIDVTSGSHTISAPLTLATNTNITLANAGSLTLSGAQAWAGHSVAVSGAGTITISGTQSNASPATFTVNTGVTANINTDGGTGLSLVNGGVTNLKSSQTLAGVTINNGAHVNVTTNTAQPVATGPSVLVTPTLSIASHVVGSDAIWDGYLDLANNKLVVQTGGLSGTALQAAVQQVASQVKSGYNLANGSGTLWMGTGIGSSSAAADTRRIVGLAVFQNNTKSFGSVDGTVSDGTGNAFITTPFGGATVAKNDTLVKFTYFGDTDLDGVITAGDYANIDLAFAHQQTLGPQSGWANGDFDYDGSITAADYSLMDSAFAAQSGALAEGVHTLGGSLSGSLGSVTAVPEPSTWLLGVLGIIGLLAMARRRRMQIAK